MCLSVRLCVFLSIRLDSSRPELMYLLYMDFKIVRRNISLTLYHTTPIVNGPIYEVFW